MAVFEWDEAKNAANIVKHGIGFGRAATIFNRRRSEHLDDRYDYGEPRWMCVGVTDDGAVITVVYTQRGDAVRVISARPANRAERQVYVEEAIHKRTDR